MRYVTAARASKAVMAMSHILQEVMLFLVVWIGLRILLGGRW
ncbi:MAG: hypothetical protein ACREFP_08680 [Acetobacteraceae bacterium]